MNKFLLYIGLSVLISGCGGGKYTGQSRQDAKSMPTDVQESYMYSTSLYGSDAGGKTAKIAVLLPMSGNAKVAGNDIKTSIETAFLRKSKPNVNISFYDLSGSQSNRENVINDALSEKPDIIIGPVFAEDTKMVREKKPSKTPVLSFTSDVNALGDNVMTLNLIPTQSIESIVRQMQSDDIKNAIIFAPNDKSGQIMASVAYKSNSLYDISTRGIFFYDSGNSESIKDASIRASMYNARHAANTRAKEVLSDILAKEKLSASDRSSLKKQLEKISRTDTLGNLPYDAILFLGTGADSKTIASFLRYYGVGNHDAAFYGTALWQDSDIASDFTMSGAKYATLPYISNNFISLFNMVGGKDPNHLTAFGYDAANLALGMLFAQKSPSAYLFDPSGYIGTNGVFRLQPSGVSERPLRIMEFNGSGYPETLKDAPDNFLTTLYNVQTTNVRPISGKELSTRGINPGDYITIPEKLRKKSEYRTKSYGANYVDDSETDVKTGEPIQIYAPTDEETVSNPDFEPVELESVSRKNIDSVEVEE